MPAANNISCSQDARQQGSNMEWECPWPSIFSMCSSMWLWPPSPFSIVHLWKAHLVTRVERQKYHKVIIKTASGYTYKCMLQHSWGFSIPMISNSSIVVPSFFSSWLGAAEVQWWLHFLASSLSSFLRTLCLPNAAEPQSTAILNNNSVKSSKSKLKSP